MWTLNFVRHRAGNKKRERLIQISGLLLATARFPTPRRFYYFYILFDLTINFSGALHNFALVNQIRVLDCTAAAERRD
jgi:hypothetical protein